MSKKYTKDDLEMRLKKLLNQYGKLSSSIVDNEPNFPTRKVFIRVFGSLENAFLAIGYKEYNKHAYDIQDAQRVLDEKNGNFDLLSFNGMRNKNNTKCRTCGYEWEVVTDNLLRNHTKNHGCPNCSNRIKEYRVVIDKEVVQYSITELKDKYPRKDNKGYIYRITNIINYKKYIGSTIYPYERWRSHIHASHDKNNPCYNYPLQNAIRKYGLENFAFEIIEENIEINQLKSVELEKILFYDSMANTGWGYNQTLDTECAIRFMHTKGARCALVDKNNEILEVFSSYHEASLKVFGVNNKFSSIRRVCKGSRNAVLGNVFRDLDENGNVILHETKTNPRYTSIYGININNESDVVYYKSISEASREEKISRSTLQFHLNNKTPINERKWYKNN